MIGHFVFTTGCVSNATFFLFFGRFLFGIGGESFQLTISALIAEAFAEKQLFFAMGCLLSLSRLTHVCSLWTPSILLRLTGDIATVMIIGCIILIFGFSAASFIGFDDNTCSVFRF
jgi:hypothetical protein